MQFGSQLTSFIYATPSWLKLLLVPLVCAVVSVFYGQDTNWDLQNYHLYNAYAFLNDRLLLDLAPAGQQSYFNPFLDIAWYALVQLLPPVGVGAVLGFLHGLNFCLVYLIARELLPGSARRQQWAWWLAVAGIVSIGFLSELGNSMHDNVVSLFILGALLLVLRELARSKVDWRMLVLAGLLAGAVSALKLVTGLYALALCMSLLALPLAWPRKFRLAFLYCAGVGAGFLLAGGYWFYLIWSQFGNPLFPLFNGWFGGELANAVLIRDTRFLPQTWSEFVSYPLLMSLNPERVSEYEFEQYSWATIYVVLLLLGVKLLVTRVFRRQAMLSQAVSPQVCLLLVFFGCSLLVWLKLFSIYRYLVAGELLLPLTLVLACGSLSPGRGYQVGSWLVLVLTLANWSGEPDWGHSDWREQAYRVEQPTDKERVGTVVLMGQPLGWLVPALDMPVPFLQALPNMPIEQSNYSQELLSRINDDREIRAIFNPGVNSPEQVSARIAQGPYLLQQDSCQSLVGQLGSETISYQYCAVIRKPGVQGVM